MSDFVLPALPASPVPAELVERCAPTEKPHILSAKVDRWGELAFMLSCPYTLADREIRQCLMGLEPGEACLLACVPSSTRSNCHSRNTHRSLRDRCRTSRRSVSSPPERDSHVD